MSDKRETFAELLNRHPHLQPLSGETMASVYRKEHEAFIQYVDEQVAAKMAEIDAAFGLPAEEVK